MNKNYYEFTFISDQGKNISVKVPNAVETYNVSQFAEDMDTIITSQVISTSKGRPVAKRLVKYVEPKTVQIPVQQNNN